MYSRWARTLRAGSTLADQRRHHRGDDRVVAVDLAEQLVEDELVVGERLLLGPGESQVELPALLRLPEVRPRAVVVPSFPARSAGVSSDPNSRNGWSSPFRATSPSGPLVAVVLQRAVQVEAGQRPAGPPAACSRSRIRRAEKPNMPTLRRSSAGPQPGRKLVASASGFCPRGDPLELVQHEPRVGRPGLDRLAGEHRIGQLDRRYARAGTARPGTRSASRGCGPS